MRRALRVLRAAAQELLLPAAYARLAWRARSWTYAKGVLGAEEPTWNHAVYRARRELGIRFPDLPVRAVELYGQAGEDLVASRQSPVASRCSRRRRCGEGSTCARSGTSTSVATTRWRAAPRSFWLIVPRLDLLLVLDPRSRRPLLV